MSQRSQRSQREIVFAAVGTLAGVLVASAAWSLRASPAPRATPEPTSTARPDDDDLAAANQRLVESLQEADRTIAQLREALGERRVDPPTPAPSDAPRDDREAPRRRPRGEPTQEDWERMAQLGVVRVRMPCLRDVPWTPSARVLDRLGLAPDDAAIIRDAYAASNKRMAEVIRPLCAQTLGSGEAAERVGPKACADAILASAQRGDPEAARRSVVRVAETNAGKAQGGGSGGAIEQLLLSMTRESKAFEADLAQKLGPEEAKRLASAPEMCSDRTVVRGGERDDDDREPFGRRGRGARGEGL